MSKWLIAAVTFLVSSGLLAVFGSITGELYWDGYLSAFGLGPDEFPATGASVRVYAYVAVFHAVNAVAGKLFDHWIWILLLAVVGVTIGSLVNESAIKGRLLPRIGVLQRFAQDDTWRGIGVRLSALLVVLLGILLFVGYLTLCAWLAVSAPLQARPGID